MIETFPVPSPETLALFDDVIDARSPSEFAEDRLPGAINLPVLDDAERARVGTIYVQESRFLARRIGAALVAANIARHLDCALADRGPKWRPLIYCWRGGMRSGAMATILSQIGWRVGVLDGGYRAWRRAVVTALSDHVPLFPFVAIDGATGVGKTALIAELARTGAQTLDLEALARHRGSVFGADGDQPTQKLFETAAFDALRRADLSRPIFVEAESSRIGRINLPPRVFASLAAAPRILIEAPILARARFTAAHYRDLADRAGFLDAAIGRLKAYHSKETIAEWRALAAARADEALAAALMAAHYDPAYSRVSARRPAPVATLRLAAIDAAALNDAAQQIAALSPESFAV